MQKILKCKKQKKYKNKKLSGASYLNNRTEDFLLLLLLLLPNVFAHFTKIALTWPFIKLGPPDCAW